MTIDIIDIEIQNLMTAALEQVSIGPFFIRKHRRKKHKAPSLFAWQLLTYDPLELHQMKQNKQYDYKVPTGTHLITS